MNPASGGPCQGIRNSIPELEKLGIKNEVACLDDPSASFLRQDSFPIHPLGPARKPWAYCAKLIPWLMENLPRFDAVIIHGLWLYHGYAVRKALQQLVRTSSAKRGKMALPSPSTELFQPTANPLRLPSYYVMPHGMLDPYFQRDSARRVKAARNWFYWKLIEGKVVNEAQGVLFTCEEELRLAREPFRPYRPKQELNIGYGIAEPPPQVSQPENAFRKNSPKLGDRPYLLFLGRIHPKKGVDLLIRAYANLAKSWNRVAEIRPFPALVIAGPLDSNYAKVVQQLAAELFPPCHEDAASSPAAHRIPPPTIHFPGMLQGESKWGAFYGCEAFVLPSHQENFGIAVVEALACGKPVLISNKVNIWREIENAGGGFVSEDNDTGTRMLLERWLLLPESKRVVMSESARSAYHHYFAVAPAAKAMIKALQNEQPALSDIDSPQI